MFVRARLTPRRVRTEARFRGLDPWNGDAPAEISIEAYYYVPEDAREAPAPWRWCDTPLYALRSGIDGAERFLPDALSLLWRTGKVPAEELPGLLREMEPDLEGADFRPLQESRTERRLAAIGMAALFAAGGLLVTWPREGAPSPAALLCGAVLAGGILAALLLLPAYAARKRRRRRQMGWALARRTGAQPGRRRAA